MPEHLLTTSDATATQYLLVPCVQSETALDDYDAIGNRIAKLTVSRQDWAAIRRHNAPPPEWLDNDDDYASLET